MDLLTANDPAGEYPQSWYAETVAPLARCPELKGEVRADVCVVGGGYTGLSAALHLAERGYSVALVEAQRVGFGASGRNGGQLGSGQRMHQPELERLVGRDDARKLWALAEEAKAVVRGLIARHGIDCHLRDGVATYGYTDGERREIHEEAEMLARDYGYDRIELLDEAKGRELCRSPAYRGGMLDMGAGHLHPLAFALGLARACLAAGVQVFEGSRVHGIEHGAKPVVKTGHGRVVCEHVVLGCNGYLGTLDRKVAARVMPINNFIVATEPLEAGAVLTRDVAVADTKFVVNYFRMSHDNRLLFGGGESYGYRFPSDIEAVVRKPMSQVFPQLKDVKITHAWGGTLAITRRRAPYFARLAPNVLSASGYSGHGLGTATHAGLLMAQAIAGEAEGFDTMARVPALPFPGGGMGRTPLLVLAMTWFAMRDRLGI
ncbi:NAD(P)/FAD-dependent oxidoreductase [Mesobacterium pallidum]|uniref:NAD(P)/FAD-dependent oxidoreductase n=1 Tax=Mesobacterium pallidum TaxID=2872037 RepID=UPI001EE3069C|nr:FAD-binding oxidoreductase [Mesobacterium pallidum]